MKPVLNQKPHATVGALLLNFFVQLFRRMAQTLQRRQNRNQRDAGAAEWLLNSISFPSTVWSKDRKARR